MHRNALYGVLLAGVLVAGCGRGRDPDIVADEAIQAAVQENRDGNPEEAITILREAFVREGNPDERTRILETEIRILLAHDRFDEAEDRLQKMLAQDAVVGQGVFGTIHAYFSQNKLAERLVGWTTKLKDMPLQEEHAERAYEWYMQALAGAERFDDAIACIPECMQRFDWVVARRILDLTRRRMFQMQRFDEAAKFLDAVEQHAMGESKLRSMVAIARMELHIAQEAWPQAEAQYRSIADSLDDDDLRWALASLTASARQAEEFELEDRACEFVVTSQPEKLRAVREAAGRWVFSLRRTNDNDDAVRRLDILQRTGLAPRYVFSLLRAIFYEKAETVGEETARALLGIADRISDRMEDEAGRVQVRALKFDGLFMLEDYEDALELLSKGLPDRDEAWHAMADNKIRAHMALRDGRVEEAVKRFREFMDSIAETWSGSERDPSTGIRYTLDMTLGLNAKRIGDILAKSGKHDAARSAYREALDHYGRAAEDKEIKAGSREAALIGGEAGHVREVMAKLP